MLRTALLFYCILNCLSSIYSQATLSYSQVDSLFLARIAVDDYHDLLDIALDAVERSKTEFGTQDTLYARMLYYTATAYDFDVENYEKAQFYYEKAATIQKKKYKLHPDYANTLIGLANMNHFFWEDYQKAEQQYFEAIEIQKKTIGTQHTHYAWTVHELAILFMHREKYELAFKYIEEALNIRIKNLGKQHFRTLESVLIKASILTHLDRYQDAESLLLEYKNHRLQDDSDQHRILHISRLSMLTDIYSIMGKRSIVEDLYLENIQFSEKNLKKFNNRNNQLLLVYCLKGLALYYRDQRLFEKAEPLLKRCLDITKKTSGIEHSDYASIEQDLAHLHYNLQNYGQAKYYYHNALSKYAAIFGDSSEYCGNILLSLANLNDNLGKEAEAELLFKRAIEIVTQIYGTKHSIYSNYINHLANFYRTTNRTYEAELYYLKYLEIQQTLFGPFSLGVAYAHNNLGLIYYNIGRYEDAEKQYKASLKITAQIYDKEHDDYAVSLNNLGNLYSKIGRSDEALFYLEESISIIEQVLGQNSPLYINHLYSLSHHYWLEQKYTKALALCFRSIILNSSVDPAAFFPKESNWFKQDFNSDSIPDLSPLLNDNVIQSLKDIQFQYNIIGNKAINFLVQIIQKIAESPEEKAFLLEFCQATMKIQQNERNQFDNDKNKLSFFAPNLKSMDIGLETAFKLKTPAAIEAAFALAEQNKSILLTDALKGSRARTLGDLPDSLALREIELHQKKEDIKKALINANPSEKNKWNAKAIQVNFDIQAFRNQIKEQYPKYHALKYENITASIADLQALLPPNSNLIEYFMADTVVYAFKLSPKKLDLFVLPTTVFKTQEEAQKLRKTLSDYQYIMKMQNEAFKNFNRSAYWFYETFIAPLDIDSEVQQLIIIPDGVLGHLPFEAFLKKNTYIQGSKPNYKDLDYLVKHYSISYNYAATLLKENYGKASNNKGTLLACAASYQKPDSSLLELRAPHLFELRNLLNELPAAQNEVITLAEQFKGDFLYGQDCNESLFKSKATEHSIIHLAMHGLLFPRTPMLSSLVFSEDHQEDEDNFLQAYEISRLKLNADLVVLSACETGYGKYKQGEGVLSLARSFMYAGVPSLVVSLWSVNDQSTSQIMQLFYKNLAQGIAKNEALRLAKLEYINKTKGLLVHPAFWSPFIQLGNSEAILLKPKTNYWSWLLGACFLIIILIFIGIRNKTPKAE